MSSALKIRVKGLIGVVVIVDDDDDD